MLKSIYLTDVAMELKQKNTMVFLKKAFQRAFLNFGHTEKYIQFSGQEASDKIEALLMQDAPAMICRFGSTELQCISGFIRESNLLKNYGWYERFHWDDLRDNICTLSGFFPKDKDLIRRFYDMMVDDIKEIDILGSWRKEEHYVAPLIDDTVKIRLKDIEPYLHANPWSKALKDKKVLVIHPFDGTIRSQYKNRGLLFDNPDTLPQFELQTIKAVQSIAGNETTFNSWFDALDHMKKQIDESDFDIALIGCGAYGFPLAAHVKRAGKKAVHIGGALQLMFGIMGKRWEQNENILKLKNKHWVYPSQSDAPKNKEAVEGGCYW